jgi:hypothetical protein
LSPAYRSRALSGQVTFDYSNNNGRYALGEGHFLFETQWSKASHESIHAYNDRESIRSVALAKDGTTIAQVRDASSYDYSSRSRTARIEQVVLWVNVNGLYAAPRILAIKDDSRGGKHDELTFEYVILADGSSDFGR